MSASSSRAGYWRRPPSGHAVGHDHQRPHVVPPSAQAGALADLLVRLLLTSPMASRLHPRPGLRAGDTRRLRAPSLLAMQDVAGHGHQQPPAATTSPLAGVLAHLHVRLLPTSRRMRFFVLVATCLHRTHMHQLASAGRHCHVLVAALGRDVFVLALSSSRERMTERGR